MTLTPGQFGIEPAAASRAQPCTILVDLAGAVYRRSHDTGAGQQVREGRARSRSAGADGTPATVLVAAGLAIGVGPAGRIGVQDGARLSR